MAKKKIWQNVRPRQPPKKNHTRSGAVSRGLTLPDKKKGAKSNTAFKGSGRLSPNSKQRKWRGEKGVGTTRIQSGLQTSTRSQPQQLKQRQRRAALRGRLSRSPRRRTVLGVAGPASAHPGPHRRYQASTGGGAPDSPTGAAVKQPAASSQRASYQGWICAAAAAAKHQSWVYAAAPNKHQSWVYAVKHRAASVFLLRRGELFFSSAAGEKNLGFSGLASRPKKEPESWRTGQPAKKKIEEKNTRAGPVLGLSSLH
jgi:hypothetical protein